jgi:hypothetical protein
VLPAKLKGPVSPHTVHGELEMPFVSLNDMEPLKIPALTRDELSVRSRKESHVSLPQLWVTSAA